ncbi:sensory box histidine kinase [Carboxydothermus pertinax]|uniref:histidine kinase n=2 Tax=Carboxydothermus pertinax TaxID=870242 RepID=A0A1L8CRW2_9THEO|nr:sensory box histidine kinase [Carboxydothermus pertinax]
MPLVVLGAILYYIFYIEIPELTQRNLSYAATHLASEIEGDFYTFGLKDAKTFFDTYELSDLNHLLTWFPGVLISFIEYPEVKAINYSNENGHVTKDPEIISKEFTAEIKNIITQKKYPYYGKLNLPQGKAYIFLQPIYLKGKLSGFIVAHQNQSYLSFILSDLFRVTGSVVLLLLLAGVGYGIHYLFLVDRRTIALTKSNWDLQRKLKAVLESAQIGVILIDREKTISYVNPMAEEFFKIISAEAIGKKYEEFIKNFLLTDDKTKSSLLIHTLQTGNPVLKKQITFKVDGKVRFGEVCTGVIYNFLGQMEGAFLLIQDITEKKQIEELNVKNQQLAAAGEIMSELTHELKNSFMVLKGLSKLCQDGRPELKMLDEEINRLYHLTLESLNLTKAYRAKKERIDFYKLVVESLALIDKEARKQKVKVETFLHYPPYFYGDRNLLKQALLNVFLNAVEAMEGGGCLKVYLDYNIKSKEMILTVADNGPGIPTELLQKVNQPFFTTKENGTGLGLPFTKRVVEFHLGKLTIKSEVGKGTWVIITLPVEEAMHGKAQVV